ncbi:MAG: Coenzyme F420 hydrogenase/dehydrogenase, beta subunit C-terminal domain [Paludibacteraceae bacterium]|nr:Coenzyme F420 hydrogenase/dehydrogenase, beta subunit C-terminal domain [Paludibacteraceae bacterium]
MPTLAQKNTCTACAACMNTCGKDAIKMKPQGRLGHLYPLIDIERCVECGMCEKVCPVLNPISLNSPQTAYAGWAKSEEENKKSTSGGAASVLSRKVIKEGGVVYGCANIGMEVMHMRIEKEDDIDILRGSKYVQSTMGLIMKQIKQDLVTGRQVLFLGSPCQCAGIRGFLRKSCENLILVDLICHGVPSLQLLQEHVNSMIEKGQTVKHIYFRDGNSYEFSLIVKNTEEEEIYRSNLWKQRYHDAYYNIILPLFRTSC